MRTRHISMAQEPISRDHTKRHGLDMDRQLRLQPLLRMAEMRIKTRIRTRRSWLVIPVGYRVMGGMVTLLMQ